jgi:hypothetical protein
MGERSQAPALSACRSEEVTGRFEVSVIELMVGTRADRPEDPAAHRRDIDAAGEFGATRRSGCMVD